MQYRALSRIIGVFFTLYTISLVPPIFVSLYYMDGQYLDFLIPLLFSLACGLLLWLPFHSETSELRRREGFLVVASFWFLLSSTSALPFVIGPHLDFIDSFFEAASAFTTTGATIMNGLDTLPPSLLYYRQQLQWLGGMGIIVLAVAVLPLLRMGGMQLYRAEIPGPLKDEKLTPRIAHTARIFWQIYLLMTFCCAFAYWLAGMTIFDAICHSMSTVSTGGFSTHDNSIGYFKSAPIEIITIIFMFLGAINFSIHYLAIYKKNITSYFANPEVRVFILIFTTVILINSLALSFSNTYPTYLESFRHTAFLTMSVITSTGYTTESFVSWPAFVITFVFFISFIGGCSGSTAGGMKVIRFMLMAKQGYHEIIRLIHPKITLPLKIQGRVYDETILSGVRGYFALYVAVFSIAMLLLMLGGLDQTTAFSAVATSLNNFGPGLGEVATNFQHISDWQKIILTFCMLLGRLELFTILILFTPEYWHK